MPKKAFTVCSSPRCNQLTHGYMCDEHQPIHDKARADAKRKRDNDFDNNRRKYKGSTVYNHRWHKARTTYLKSNQLCVKCKEDGQIEKANVVDHVVPHKRDQELFWSKSNWQALCVRCHNSKTAREDGGFGRR